MKKAVIIWGGIALAVVIISVIAIKWFKPLGLITGYNKAGAGWPEATGKIFLVMYGKLAEGKLGETVKIKNGALAGEYKVVASRDRLGNTEIAIDDDFGGDAVAYTDYNEKLYKA
jgi:hypothetical protein